MENSLVKKGEKTRDFECILEGSCTLSYNDWIVV